VHNGKLFRAWRVFLDSMTGVGIGAIAGMAISGFVHVHNLQQDHSIPYMPPAPAMPQPVTERAARTSVEAYGVTGPEGSIFPTTKLIRFVVRFPSSSSGRWTAGFGLRRFPGRRTRSPRRGHPGYAEAVSAKQKFKGALRHDGTGLNWTVITVPFDPADVWPKRQGLRVRGTINGFPFRTSLFRARDGSFILLVNRKMQKEAAVLRGHVAEVLLEPDLDERTQTTPAEMEKLLRQDRALRKFYEQLSGSMRKAIIDHIQQPKSAEVRAGRAELWAERMMLAMEGEKVTPPILEAAFLRHPKAREGWLAMTPIQRRGHLMGIFYYQSPESRQKRAQKAIEEALRARDRKQNSRED
jgi:uncharacterized protein YdeI (YjbR/CyaY-like superfamily)